MIDGYLEHESACGSIRYEENVPLSSVSTFGIGGIADYVVQPYTEKALIATVSFLRGEQIRYGIFGNCSNTLFSDRGYRGVVILTRLIKGFDVVKDDNGAAISASCGANVVTLSEFACKNSLTGLEFACSIPATVAGALYMNAGAYGGCMGDIVVKSRYLNTRGEVITTAEHDFGYRKSRYTDSDSVILGCTMRLSFSDREKIRETMIENRKRRKASQPVGERSAGSVFKRSDDVIPAKLIDAAGLKGLRVGGAAVSEKHAGFIVNKGSASCSDVLDLIGLVKEKIYTRYGVTLVPEIKIISEF